jgi:hypothetical protein
MSKEEGHREEYRSGHPPPERKTVTIGEMAGHKAPAKVVHGSGHPPPAAHRTMNMAPPPKRADSESSAKPPDRR